MLFLLALLAGCRTLPPLPPVDLDQPGWTVRQGQAVWKRAGNTPEIAGEILVATRPDGSAFAQFSKNPFPLVIAQGTTNRWQIEMPTENKHYAGRGRPPSRLVFLQLARALVGEPLPRGWAWRKTADGGRIENRSTGESLEIFFNQ